MFGGWRVVAAPSPNSVRIMFDFDVAGIGLNATDTVILVPHFPAYAGKVAFDEEMLSPGGRWRARW